MLLPFFVFILYAYSYEDRKEEAKNFSYFL